MKTESRELQYEYPIEEGGNYHTIKCCVAPFCFSQYYKDYHSLKKAEDIISFALPTTFTGCISSLIFDQLLEVDEFQVQ